MSKHASIEVIVAADDDSDYAEVIRAMPGFSGGATHTEGSAGKCLPHITSSGDRGSTIVFPRNTFLTIKSALEKSEDISAWDNEQLMYLYVVAHEVGHALDYCQRSNVEPELQGGYGGTIEQLENYYGVLYTDELAACLIALPAVRDEHIPLLAANAIARIVDAFDQVDSHGDQCYWIGAIEWAKYVGSVSALAREGLTTQFARAQSEAFTELASPFATAVTELEQSYPNWKHREVVSGAAVLANEFKRLLEGMSA